MRNSNDDRISDILAVLDAANGEVESTPKFHSLVFLCQYAGTDLQQDFDFQCYRLFSQTLARDLDRAVASGQIDRAGDSGKISKNVRKSTRQKPDGIAVVSKLHSESDNTLEVLAVLCYLHKVGYTNDELASKLDELKPEFRNCFTKAFSLAASVFSIRPKMLAHS